MDIGRRALRWFEQRDTARAWTKGTTECTKWCPVVHGVPTEAGCGHRQDWSQLTADRTHILSKVCGQTHKTQPVATNPTGPEMDKSTETNVYACW